MSLEPRRAEHQRKKENCRPHRQHALAHVVLVDEYAYQVVQRQDVNPGDQCDPGIRKQAKHALGGGEIAHDAGPRRDHQGNHSDHVQRRKIRGEYCAPSRRSQGRLR